VENQVKSASFQEVSEGIVLYISMEETKLLFYLNNSLFFLVRKSVEKFQKIIMKNITQKLNLPEYNLRIKQDKSNYLIYDEFRKKYVVLTPEEWVRQNFIHYLVNELSYPKSRISIEFPLNDGEKNRRCDAVIFDKTLKPQAIIECKKPDVKISQSTFNQIGRYNILLKVKYLIITNGFEHYFCKIDHKDQTFKFYESIPDYSLL
jgi:hypothetical protein